MNKPAGQKSSMYFNSFPALSSVSSGPLGRKLKRLELKISDSQVAQSICSCHRLVVPHCHCTVWRNFHPHCTGILSDHDRPQLSALFWTVESQELFSLCLCLGNKNLPSSACQCPGQRSLLQGSFHFRFQKLFFVLYDTISEQRIWAKGEFKKWEVSLYCRIVHS